MLNTKLSKCITLEASRYKVLIKTQLIIDTELHMAKKRSVLHEINAFVSLTNSSIFKNKTKQGEHKESGGQ